MFTREDCCDGLGDCLPECPTGAISFEEREAPAYDEAAVLAAKQTKTKEQDTKMPHVGCPGMQVRQMEPPKTESSPSYASTGVSQLGQWPCQIKLAPVNAPYFNGARLLIAADCTAYAYANIHEDSVKNKFFTREFVPCGSKHRRLRERHGYFYEGKNYVNWLSGT